MVDNHDVLSIIIAIISSGVLSTIATIVYQTIQNKKSKLNIIEKKVDKATNEVKSCREDLSEHKATLARTHILRFADELRNGTVHSEEYFKQQILDIDTYTRYCETHPNFSNGLTVMASEYIREEYRKNYLGGDDAS